MRTIGAFEAKTHLSRLLDEVEKGGEIVITRRGKEVARLVRARPASERDPAELVEAIIAFGKGRSLGGYKIRDLIEEGRA